MFYSITDTYTRVIEIMIRFDRCFVVFSLPSSLFNIYFCFHHRNNYFFLNLFQ